MMVGVPLLWAAGVATAIGADAPAVPAPIASPFAWVAPLEGDEPGQMHRVQIPLQVYDTARDPRLQDVRVFDSRGVAMPFAWVQPKLGETSQTPEIAVPLFPVQLTATSSRRRGSSDGLSDQVERNEDGSLRASASAAASPARNPNAVVLDLSRIRGDLQSLVLADFQARTGMHNFRLDASDNLEDWRVVRQEAQIVRLSHGDMTVEQNRVELGNRSSDTSRYLRIVWSDPATAPKLSRVTVRVNTHPGSARPMLWTEPQKPVGAEGQSFTFQAPPAMPIERLRVNLPQSDVLSPVLVYQLVQAAAAPAAATGQGATPAPAAGTWTWQLRAQAVSYRLESSIGEIVSPDVLLGGSPMPSFGVSLDPRAANASRPPTVQIGFSPRTLVFTAQGVAPYVMAWGADNMGDVSVPPSTLIVGYDGIETLPAAVTARYPGRRDAGDTLKLAPPPKPPAPPVQPFRLADQWWFTLLLAAVDMVLLLIVWRQARRAYLAPTKQAGAARSGQARRGG